MWAVFDNQAFAAHGLVTAGASVDVQNKVCWHSKLLKF